MTRGIYSITHIATGWRYIGMSGHIEKRWFNHRARLRDKKHSCEPLQRVYNRDGLEAFRFEVLEEAHYYDELGLEGYYYKLYADLEMWAVDLEAAGYPPLSKAELRGRRRRILRQRELRKIRKERDTSLSSRTMT